MLKVKSFPSLEHEVVGNAQKEEVGKVGEVMP